MSIFIILFFLLTPFLLVSPIGVFYPLLIFFYMYSVTQIQKQSSSILPIPKLSLLIFLSLAYLFVTFILSSNSFAATSSILKQKAIAKSLSVSVLTFGPGQSLHSQWGHNALRIKINSKDIVYDFGTFNYSKNVISSFLLGENSFWLSIASYSANYSFYSRYGRFIFEQQIMLSDKQKVLLQKLLDVQAKPENKFYVYHYAKANCSSKLRDILNIILNNSIKTQTQNVPFKSLRQISDPLVKHILLAKIFSDLLFDSSHDKVISLYSAMGFPLILKDFLPFILLHNNNLNLSSNNISHNKIATNINLKKTSPLLLSQKYLLKASLPKTPSYANTYNAFFVAFITFVFISLAIAAMPLGLYPPLRKFLASSALIILAVPIAIFSLISIHFLIVLKYEISIVSHLLISIPDLILPVAGLFCFNIMRQVFLLRLWLFYKLFTLSTFFFLLAINAFAQPLGFIFIFITIFYFIIWFLVNNLSRALSHNR